MHLTCRLFHDSTIEKTMDDSLSLFFVEKIVSQACFLGLGLNDIFH